MWELSGYADCAAALALLSLTSCADQRPVVQEGRSEAQSKVTRVALPGAGYVYDVAVAHGAVWVTSHAGLWRIDLVTDEAVNVLPSDYLFRVAAGHGALWVTTGSDGHVLRFDPASEAVTAEIDVREGPVTELTVSEDAVWASATSDLVRIDPVTNEVVGRLSSRTGFGDLAFGKSGLWVIAGAGADGEVWQIDPATTDVRARIPLANPSFWNQIAVEDEAVWVTSSPVVHQAGTALVRLSRIDASTRDISAHIPLGQGHPELGPDEGAVSYSGVAFDEGSVWAYVSWGGLLLRVDTGDLTVSEWVDGLDCCGSDVGPGLTTGGGSLWITASSAVIRVSLET